MLKKSFIFILLLCLSIQNLYADEKVDTSVASAIQVSKAFGAVAKKAYPSVVIIENIQSINKRGNHHAPFPFFIPRKTKPSPSKSLPRFMPVGRGSGFIVRTDGYVVTNQHVIKNAKFLRVKTKDGEIYDNQINKDAVKVIGVDEHSDIAILKLDLKGKKLPVLNFADSNKVDIGNWALAVGAPFNYDYTLTIGIVSQVGRHNVFRNRVFESYIQTDASINPGNSGGPLLNIRGDVIGVNNFIATGGFNKSSAGIGFAITGNLVKRVTSQIIKNGKVQRPWLGIVMKDLSPNERKAFEIDNGVLITKVVKGHPAHKAGLISGDIVLKVGESECTNAYDVQSAVLRFNPGDYITLSVKRDNKIKDIKIKAVVRDKHHLLVNNRSTNEFDRLGIKLEETKKGLVIFDIDNSSPAYKMAGLRKGMMILSINRQKFSSLNSLNKFLTNFKGHSLMLKVQHEGNISIEFLKWQ